MPLSVDPRLTNTDTDIHNQYPNLVLEVIQNNKKDQVYLIWQKDLSIASSAWPIYNPHLLVSSRVGGEPQLEFQVFFHSICTETYI